MAYYVPPRLKKWGDTSPVSPTKLCPWKQASTTELAARVAKCRINFHRLIQPVLLFLPSKKKIPIRFSKQSSGIFMKPSLFGWIFAKIVWSNNCLIVVDSVENRSLLQLQFILTGWHWLQIWPNWVLDHFLISIVISKLTDSLWAVHKATKKLREVNFYSHWPCALLILQFLWRHSFTFFVPFCLLNLQRFILAQGCQIGSFGAKKQNFGSFEKQLAPKFLFGYLATFWLFCNVFVPQNFLGEELRVVRVACPRHHKTRSGPPYNCVMFNEHPNIPEKRYGRCASGTRNLFHAVSIESVPAAHCIVLNFNVCTRHEVHRAQAHTVSTTQNDNNRHRGFCNVVGVGPQDNRHFL